MDNNKIKVFEDKKIRAIWSDEAQDWYFSIVDICEILTEASNPRRYWSDLKRKLKAEGSQLYENIVQLKMEAPDGKMRMTDVATTEQLLRLIQSIPSPKAEPFKLWLAQVAKQGGSVAKAARKEYELQTGKDVVSPLNALNLKALKDKSKDDGEGDE